MKLLKENSGIILSIENTGYVIANPISLFDRFYRENDASSGLGLSIIKEICDKKDIYSKNNRIIFKYIFNS